MLCGAAGTREAVTRQSRDGHTLVTRRLRSSRAAAARRSHAHLLPAQQQLQLRRARGPRRARRRQWAGGLSRRPCEGSPPCLSECSVPVGPRRAPGGRKPAASRGRRFPTQRHARRDGRTDRASVPPWQGRRAAGRRETARARRCGLPGDSETARPAPDRQRTSNRCPARPNPSRPVPARTGPDRPGPPGV